MCSYLAQIVYGFVLLAILALTLSSLFTPSWRQVQNGSTTATTGFFSCNSTDTKSAYCKEWWSFLHDFEKVVVVFLFLALAVEIIALGWNAFSFCACCCKKYVIHPLSGLSLFISIFLAVAVIVYGVNNQEIVDQMRQKMESGQKVDQDSFPLGYSYFLAIGALVLAIANTIVAAVAVCCADKCI